MPGLYKRGSIFWGRVVVGGKEHRRSLRTSARTVARRRLAAWVDGLQDMQFGIAPRRWREAVARWCEEIAPRQYKPATRQRYIASLRVVDPYLSDLHVHEVDRAILAKIANRPGVTNATRRRDLTAVETILHCCVQWGWLDKAPTYERRYIRERRDPITLPPDAEVAGFVRACHAAPDRGRGPRLAQPVRFRPRLAGIRY